MTNKTNAIATVNSANIDMTTLMNMLKNANATVIIINNNGTPIDLSNIIDSTATEVTRKGHPFDLHKYYVGRVKGILNRHDIKVKTGKGGAKKGHISAKALDTLVSQLETKEVSMRKIKFLFDALSEAGYREEGRGLKNDIVFETLDYIKENNFARNYSNGTCNKEKYQYELDNLTDTLRELILTNDFRIKFHDFLRKDEVAYATFELAEEKTA